MKNVPITLASSFVIALSAGQVWAQKAENKLRWASTVPITTPDPYYNIHREAMILNGQLIWDTLVYRNPESDAYEPLLATSWEWIDETTLHFELRTDVTFHDGRPFTAADVAYTYNYISDIDNKINVQSNVNWIERAEAIGDDEVRLFLKSPFPAALEYISSLHAILPDGFFGEDSQAGAGTGLIGTGPYKLSDFSPGTSIRLERWEGYFADSPKGSPEIAEIEYRSIPDQSTQTAEILGGGLDWIWYVPSDQAEPLSRVPDVAVTPAETMRVSFLSFNVREMEGGNPLRDKRVRQAIAHAIDRQTIVDQIIGRGSSVVPSACFRTQFGCTDDVVQYGYDPEKAKALLAEAGYADGLTLELVSNVQRDRAWAEAVAGYLGRVGVRLNIHMLLHAAAAEKRASNTVHLHLGDWGSYGINDVSALLANFFTFTSDDMARDELVADALRQAAVTVDQDTRLSLYRDAIGRIAEELYWQPMWTNPVTYAHHPDLEFQPYADENPRFFNVKWRD